MIDTEVIDQVRERLVAAPSDDPGAVISRFVDDLLPLAAHEHRCRLVAQLGAELLGMGPLQELLDDPEVDEVLVNAGAEVWIERGGRLARAGRLRPGQADTLLERVLLPLGLRIDRLHPTIDARLSDGSRVSAVVAPLAVDGTCIAIRRFRLRTADLTAFADECAVAVLSELVERRCNAVVSGATSSGKTTLLNALAAHIPTGERVITIEDTAELCLETEHVVRLECRPASADGPGAVTVRDLLRAALRLRPDRLVVGEVRGPEALDMVQALNTGHDGSLSTCHANSPDDAVRRIEAMALQGGAELPLDALRVHVHSSFDVVIHVERSRDGRRRVREIAELAPSAGIAQRTRTIWKDGSLVGTLERAR